MIRPIGRLNPESVKRLVEELRRDERLRAEAVKLARRSFWKFMETAFQLTPEQRKTMRMLIDRSSARIITEAAIRALETGGPISFTVRPANSPLKAEWKVGGGCEVDPFTGKTECKVEVGVEVSK